MDISIEKYLLDNEKNKLFDVTYYLFPERWSKIAIDNSILNFSNWSEEIKYLDKEGGGLSRKIGSITVSVLPNPSFMAAAVCLNLAHEKNPKTHPG